MNHYILTKRKVRAIALDPQTSKTLLVQTTKSSHLYTLIGITFPDIIERDSLIEQHSIITDAFQLFHVPVALDPNFTPYTVINRNKKERTYILTSVHCVGIEESSITSIHPRVRSFKFVPLEQVLHEPLTKITRSVFREYLQRYPK